jgi:hypothetical protein
LEARIGIDAALGQALQDAIPEYLGKAVREHNIDLIAQPNVTLLNNNDPVTEENPTPAPFEYPVKFEATCEVRPEIQVPGYAGLRVELVNPSLSNEELDEAISTERRRFGTLVDVDRAAEVGDNIVIDLEGTRNGEPVPGLKPLPKNMTPDQEQQAKWDQFKYANPSATDLMQNQTSLRGQNITVRGQNMTDLASNLGINFVTLLF